jgi:hypothetical protein
MTSSVIILTIIVIGAVKYPKLGGIGINPTPPVSIIFASVLSSTNYILKSHKASCSYSYIAYTYLLPLHALNIDPTLSFYKLSPKSSLNFSNNIFCQCDTGSSLPKKKRSILGSSVNLSPSISLLFS